jgi:hypothetical protein
LGAYMLWMVVVAVLLAHRPRSAASSRTGHTSATRDRAARRSTVQARQ